MVRFPSWQTFRNRARLSETAKPACFSQLATLMLLQKLSYGLPKTESYFTQFRLRLGLGLGA